MSRSGKRVTDSHNRFSALRSNTDDKITKYSSKTDEQAHGQGPIHKSVHPVQQSKSRWQPAGGTSNPHPPHSQTVKDQQFISIPLAAACPAKPVHEVAETTNISKPNLCLADKNVSISSQGIRLTSKLNNPTFCFSAGASKFNGDPKSSSQHVYSDLTTVLSGSMDGRRSPSTQCPTGVRYDGEQLVSSSSGTDGSTGSVHSTVGGNQCITTGASYNPSTVGPCTREREHQCTTTQSMQSITTSPVPPASLEFSGASKSFSKRIPKSRMRHKDLARGHNIGCDISTTCGDTGPYKKPRRNFESRDANNYSMGFGCDSTTNIQSPTNSTSGCQSSGTMCDTRENQE